MLSINAFGVRMAGNAGFPLAAHAAAAASAAAHKRIAAATDRSEDRGVT
jgi:hypothetical protein